MEVIADVRVPRVDANNDRLCRKARFGLVAPGEKEAGGQDEGNPSHGRRVNDQPRASM